MRLRIVNVADDRYFFFDVFLSEFFSEEGLVNLVYFNRASSNTNLVLYAEIKKAFAIN